MYCKYCGRKFEPWLDKQDRTEKAVCYPCRDIRSDHSKLPRKRFCIICGNSLKPNSYYKMPDGSLRPWWGSKKFCEECTGNKTPTKIFPVKRKPLSEHSKQVHRENSKRWQKEHPERIKASQLARYHTDLNTILYECPCNVEKKHLHHPDYRFPHILVKLCPACHSAEHKRLRALEKLAQEG